MRHRRRHPRRHRRILRLPLPPPRRPAVSRLRGVRPSHPLHRPRLQRLPPHAPALVHAAHHDPLYRRMHLRLPPRYRRALARPLYLLAPAHRSRLLVLHHRPFPPKGRRCRPPRSLPRPHRNPAALGKRPHALR